MSKSVDIPGGPPTPLTQHEVSAYESSQPGEQSRYTKRPTAYACQTVRIGRCCQRKLWSWCNYCQSQSVCPCSSWLRVLQNRLNRSRFPCSSAVGVHVWRDCVTRNKMFAIINLESGCFVANFEESSTARSDIDVERVYVGWNDVTELMVTIGSPFCGYNLAKCVQLMGEYLPYYSIKISPVSLRARPHDH